MMFNFTGDNSDKTFNHIKNIYAKSKGKVRSRKRGLGKLFGNHHIPAKD